MEKCPEPLATYSLHSLTQFPSLPPSTLAPTYTPYEEGSITAMVSIFTDAYPHETSWTMIDVESEAILLSESSYDYAETEYKHHVCLLPETCAVFIIVDSCGDGVHAPGGYRLSVDDKIVVDTYGSGSFNGDEDSVKFGNDCAPTSRHSKSKTHMEME